jgi:FkbM family methyltransferase
MQRTIDFRGRDIVLHGKPGDPYFDNIAIAGTNDFLIDFAARHLPNEPVILDVGANIGVTSAILAVLRPGASIYSFEPGPETFGFLCETVRPFGNVMASRVAMSDKPGITRFLDNATSGSASHLSINGNSLGGSTIEVSVSTIDQFVKERSIDHVDLIKIDVEGFEPDVISGARETIARLRPGVFVEVNSFTLIAFRNLNPRTFIESLMATFPFIYWLDQGKPRPLRSEGDLLAFIHDHLIKHGCVDDLFCAFAPLP